MLLRNISCLYSKEKIYHLKRSMSTYFINMLRTYYHAVFEIGIECVCSMFDMSVIIIVGYTFCLDGPS